MPTSEDLKARDYLFFTPPPPPRQIDPAPNGMIEVLHEVHTIKIRNHCFDATNNCCH